MANINFKEKATHNRKKYCQRCKWKFDNGEADSARYRDTNHCRRCEWEIVNHKVEDNSNGGELWTVTQDRYVPFFGRDTEPNPKPKTRGGKYNGDKRGGNPAIKKGEAYVHL